MPQRAVGMAWGIVGLVAVVGLVALGFDAARSARSGPRWKRNLLGAGLSALSFFGLCTSPGCKPPLAPTCYAIVISEQPPVEISVRLRLLKDQLLVLEAAQRDGTLDRSVMEQRLTTIAADLDGMDLSSVAAADMEAALDLLGAAREKIRVIRERMDREAQGNGKE